MIALKYLAGSEMSSRIRVALLLPLAGFIGCTLPSNPSSSGPTPTGSWSNWQIQAGTAISSPPNTYPSFVGAIQIQGTQTSGIFTTIYAPGTPTPSTTVEDYAGSFVSSTGNVTLATYGFGFSYIQPTMPNTPVPVGVTGGCVYPPSYIGPECLAIFASPSVGVQIAALTGTYVGTLTDPTKPSMIGVGTGVLTLTQASTPNSSGQFPLTGTFAFTSDITLGTNPVTGTVSGEGITVSGEGITLSDTSTAGNGPNISLTGSTNSSGTQITVSNLTWAETGVTYTFTGTLTAL
jgi:hypothetical protein